MPILDVEMTCDSDSALDDSLAAHLADAAGDIFGTAPGHTWVRVRSLPLAQYAENGGGPPVGVFPVFVTVLKATWPEGKKMEMEIAQLTERFAEICGRSPAHVHVLYDPPAAGRIAFGGVLRK